MAELSLFVDGFDADLSVRRVYLQEAISSLFCIRLRVCASHPDLDLDKLTRTGATFCLSNGIFSRKWSGIIREARQSDIEPSGLSHYRLELVPYLFTLSINQDYRIFEHRTAVEIIHQVLDERYVDHEWRIDRNAFPSLEYRVQYGESDYHFFSRIAEEAGISFFFEYQEGRGSILILSDDPARAMQSELGLLSYLHDTSGASAAPFATRIQLHRKKSPPPLLRRDIDFRRPDYPHYSDATIDPEDPTFSPRYEFAPGSSRIYTRFPPSAAASAKRPRAPGRHDPAVGKEIAERYGQADAVQTRRVSFETNAISLFPGSVCSIMAYPHSWLGPEHPLLITKLALRAEHDKEWRAQCRAVFADQPYKPQCHTKRPIVNGLQPAIVIGDDSQDIAADEYGRVKVRFFWSRLETEESCWIRVAQSWAGPGYGFRTIPRIGQEVLIGFLEGNPDEPIIVSQLPNAKMPPPYPLPANQTKTVFRSRSTGDGDGFHELSFEDRKGEELLYLRAERDKETLVRGQERELIGGNRHTLIGGHEHGVVKGNRVEEIRGDQHLAIGGNSVAKVDGEVSISIGGRVSIDIGEMLSVRVGGKTIVISAEQLLLAAADATMQSGGAFVRATPGTVFVSPIIENAGVSGGGAANAPAMPQSPVVPAAYQSFLPDGKVHLPVIGWVGGIPQVGAVPDEELICRFICECENALSPEGRREPQLCFIRKIRLYEQAARGVTRIWSEVPYDMSLRPPEPIMSRKEPWRQTGRKPSGSRIPDIIMVNDPSKPPTQDNISKVIEIKFPPDDWHGDQQKAYDIIAGTAPVEKWGPDSPCFCADRKQQPEPQKVPDVSLETAAIALLILALVLDDAVGGVADDVAIPPLVLELARRLAPLFKTPLLTP